MEVCRLPELPLAARKDGIRPPYPTFVKVFSTKWLGLMPTNKSVRIYCVWRQCRKWREMRTDWQWSIITIKESRHFTLFYSQKSAVNLGILLLCQKGRRWRWPNSRPVWLFSKLKINMCNCSNKHHSPRSKAHTWQWTTYKRWLLSWH